MPYTLNLDIHTPQDPHHLFSIATRILGARPGGAESREQPTGEGTYAVTTLPGQGLNGALTVKYRNGGPHIHPGSTPAGHQVWVTTTMTLRPDTPVSAPASATNYLIRLGAWLEERDHLWSWHHPTSRRRYSGARRFSALVDLFPHGSAPSNEIIHNQLLGNAYEANQRDGI